MSGREPVPGGRTDDPFREWDAAYVLGALSASDRRAFEEHLRTCDACRTAVGELAGIPALLRTVPADEVRDDGPAEDDDVVVELRAVARAVHERRRRRRTVLVGAPRRSSWPAAPRACSSTGPRPVPSPPSSPG